MLAKNGVPLARIGQMSPPAPAELLAPPSCPDPIVINPSRSLKRCGANLTSGSRNPRGERSSRFSELKGARHSITVQHGNGRRVRTR